MTHVYGYVKYKDPEWLEETYQDHSTVEMAEMCGVCTSTICKYMERHGIDRDQSKQPKEGKHKDGEWLREQYVDEKLSQKEIADKCDVSKSAVRNQLLNHDIPIRDKSDAAKIRAERYPNTWGTENIKDYNWWEEASEERRNQFREWLSEQRKGEDNPMWDVTGSDHHRWEENKPQKQFYASKEWEKTRQEVLERDDHKCQACGEAENLHIHHITPISAGGPRLETNNLVTLCDTHHREWEGLYLRPDTRGQE